MLSNMEEVRHPQPQRVPCLHITELSYPNHVTRKDSAIYIGRCLCVKWLIHIHQGLHKWHAWQTFKKITGKATREVMSSK